MIANPVYRIEISDADGVMGYFARLNMPGGFVDLVPDQDGAPLFSYEEALELVPRLNKELGAEGCRASAAKAYDFLLMALYPDGDFMGYYAYAVTGHDRTFVSTVDKRNARRFANQEEAKKAKELIKAAGFNWLEVEGYKAEQC